MSQPDTIPFPKLPGYGASSITISAKGYHPTRQTLTYIKGYNVASMDVGAVVHDIATMSEQPASKLTSSTTPLNRSSQDSKKPINWLENGRKVLRFNGFFKEHITESAVENHRIRRVVLLYYLENGTMQLNEPRQDNSGMPQGLLLRRDEFCMPGGAALAPSDLSIGRTLDIYGKAIRLIDCDEFTRRWYQEQGVEQAASEEVPEEPIDAFRAAQKARRHTSLGPPHPRNDELARHMEVGLGKASHTVKPDTLQQFLQNTGKVLRFWCFWDDRQSLYGDRRPFILHYYLEDDTVEVLEILEGSNGRDPFPVFLRRGQLEKQLRSGFQLVDGGSCSRLYDPTDFRIGGEVMVLGRRFVLFDCDDYTRRWYRDNMGMQESEMQPLDVLEPTPVPPRPILPPSNGYGSLEDSLQNCLKLRPKAPRKDFRQMVNKDGCVLRFLAAMVDSDTNSVHAASKDRRFVISYFMQDDTLSIYEPPQRNSGLLGGTFLERGKGYKPGSELIYKHQDLFVGAEIELHGWRFELLEADEYTLIYMENNCHLFIMADINAIIKVVSGQAKLKQEEVRAKLMEHDREGNGKLSWRSLQAALVDAGVGIQKQQVVVLARFLDKEQTGSISIHAFLKAVQLDDER